MAAFLLVSGCAKMSSPSGGPRDKNPPVVIKSIPFNGALNYKGRSIVITFNEFLVLEKISDKFMVSPPMNRKPRVFLRGKNLIVEFDEKLKDSTTYTLYFQDAIRDLNEGNPINNFQFVFSTGMVIDSLSATGNVFNSYNLEVPENTLIMMYKQLADSAPIKLLPDYISKADINGGFRLDNIQEGKYRFYALKDQNSNKKYDPKEDDFAFLETPIEITASKNFLPPPPVVKDTVKLKPGQKAEIKPALFDGEYKLFLFKGENKDRYLTSSDRKQKYLLAYTLSRSPDSSKFEFSIPGVTSNAYFIEENNQKDTIMIWLTDSTLYSQPQINTIVTYPYTDTTGLLVNKKDTIMLRFLISRSGLLKAKRTGYSITTNLSTGIIKPGAQIFFKSQTPFRQADTSRIRLFETEKTNRTKIPYSIIKDTSTFHRYFLVAKLKEGNSYLMIADSAAFSDIYGGSSDSLGIQFSVMKTELFGKLTVIIKNNEGNLIVQLLDSRESIVKETMINGNGKLEFPLLDKGKYRLRAIFDLNNDGKWTTGDFSLLRQPEPVSYYPHEIEIKSDWQLVQDDWDLRLKNTKDQNLRLKK
jgi:uncharacterized protein (DUF2141 family)